MFPSHLKMGIRCFSFCLFVYLTAFRLFGQSGNYELGARSTSLAGSSVTIEDSWSIYNNPAGLNGVQVPSVLFSYQNRYALSSLSVLGAAYLQPVPIGTAGLSAFRFGNDLYSEQKISLAFGNRLGIVALGAAINYVQFDIESVGTRGIAMVEFGGIVSFNSSFKLGAHITNINQARISVVENEQLPTIMRVGLSYQPVEGFMINGELEKDLDFEEVLKFGLEYNFYKKFYARTGILTAPFQSRFGIGMNSKRLLVDYAFGSDPGLGSIHEISVAYQFKRP